MIAMKQTCRDLRTLSKDMIDMRTSISTAIGSVISTPLCQMSTNLQRVPHQPVSFKDVSRNRPKSKRRCLQMASKSPTEDDSWCNTIPAIPEPSASFPTALDDGSNQSAEVHQSTEYPSTSTTESKNSSHLRNEIRLQLLELLHEPDDVDGLYSLTDAECATRCTLEIFIANYEDTPNGMKLKCGEDLWRDQQIGVIRTVCDDYCHHTTQVMLPRPFIIPAEEISIKRLSSSAPGYRLDLADQYFVKIWLEAPSVESQWPPIGLESRLQYNGRMQKWLQEGTFFNGDIRLCCKGLLLLDGGVCNSFDMVLKLGGLQIQTSYTLQFDAQYSLAPLARRRPSTLFLQDVESPGAGRVLAGSNSPDLAIRTRHISVSEGNDRNMEEYQQSGKPSKKSARLPALAVPKTKGRLCDTVLKSVLTAGEELDIIDENLETIWRTAKHVAKIEDRPDISNDTRDYIRRWDSLVTPLRLSSNYYVPQALLTFVKENKNWFTQRKSRITEFSLHATSLRLRGSIDVMCFAKCMNLLQECIDAFKALDATNRDSKMHGPCGTADNGNFKDKCLLDGEVFDKQKEELSTTNGKSVEEETWIETAVDKSVGDEVVGVERMVDLSMDRTATYEDYADQDEVLGYATNKEYTIEMQRLKPHRDTTKDSADEDAVHEAASEELEALEIDDFFDAENGEDTLEHPFYFHSCWQSITQRWPRIKLYDPDNFGKATVIAAIAIFQGFPNDNIDRLIALHIHHCPNENIQDLVHMYYSANDVAPEVQGVCLTELKLHRIMWEAGRELCEVWLTDVYRTEDGTRRTVREAIETATNADAWDELWKCIAKECGR